MSSPAGHYSTNVVSGSLVFTSGVLPILNKETKETPETIEEQVQLVLSTIEKIISEHGLSRKDIINCSPYGIRLNIFDSLFSMKSYAP